VTECEKKWRYLRDKFVKERRRLLDECKAAGREPLSIKSNWQHYDAMNFIAQHLRLPSNTNGAPSEDGKISEDQLSPPNSLQSPLETSEFKTEKTSAEIWHPPTSDRRTSQEYHPALPPPYFNRLTAPPLSYPANPLWAMWTNGAMRTPLPQSVPAETTRSQSLSPQLSPDSDKRAADTDSDQPKKRIRVTKDVNINLSIRDIESVDPKYSEYHFCVSLAQMMERVPPSARVDLKIKLMREVAESIVHVSASVPSSTDLLSQ